MPHPLASDPSVPDILRRRFARVTHQVVNHRDDGATAIINVIGDDAAERVLLERAACIGRRDRWERELVNVTIRDVE